MVLKFQIDAFSSDSTKLFYDVCVVSVFIIGILFNVFNKINTKALLNIIVLTIMI